MKQVKVGKVLDFRVLYSPRYYLQILWLRVMYWPYEPKWWNRIEFYFSRL